MHPGGLTGFENGVFDDALQKDVREKLVDPDSAKWGKKYIYKKHACLEVYSKNSYGGYTGKKVAWLERLDVFWMLKKIDDGFCYEAPLKELVARDEAEKAAEDEVLALLASKGYKVSEMQLLLITRDPKAEKCLVLASNALTSKRISLDEEGEKREYWERKYEDQLAPVRSGVCKSGA